MYRFADDETREYFSAQNELPPDDLHARYVPVANRIWPVLCLNFFCNRFLKRMENSTRKWRNNGKIADTTIYTL